MFTFLLTIPWWLIVPILWTLFWGWLLFGSERTWSDISAAGFVWIVGIVMILLVRYLP